MKKRILALLLSFTIGLMTIPTYNLEAAETKQEIQTNDCLEIPDCSYDTYNMSEYCQYILPAENKLYFLKENKLQFINYETGECAEECEFPAEVVYQTEKLIYGAYKNTNDTIQIQVYNIEEHKIIKTLQITEIAKDKYDDLSAIGVSETGDIYLASYNSDLEESWSKGKIWVYDAEGTFEAAQSIPGKLTAFYGFAAEGLFYYEVYYEDIDWGYAHHMAGFCMGVYENKEFDIYLTVFENMFEWGWSNHKNAVEVIGYNLMADYLGNIFNISRDENGIEYAELGNIQGRDYENAYGELGSKTLYREEDDLLIGEAESKTLAVFDTETYEKVKMVNTSYDIYNILWCDEQICCVEKENDKMYIEFFTIDDFVTIGTEIINLNEQGNYIGRTKESIVEKYAEALEENLTAELLENSGNMTAPYKESVISDVGKETIMNFTNYIRWLGGLSAYESAEETAWTEAARAAVLAYAAAMEDDYYGHSPSKPSDMSDEFFESASNAIEGNLAYYSGGNNIIRHAISTIRDWNNDVLREDALSVEMGGYNYRKGIDSPTHRFSFLQRGGSEISYGFTENTAVQNYEYAQYNPNETGTIEETDNNELAYTWPAAGYFPEEEISKMAEWSINLNTDKITLSNQSPFITITDLDTGEVWYRDLMKGFSGDIGMDITNFWGYYIYFTPPEVEDYTDKRFEVRVENLSDSDGNPVELVYTVNFFSYADVIDDPMNTTETVTITMGDLNGDLEVTINDMLILLHGVSGSQTLNEEQKLAADIDEDGEVTVRDMLRLMHYISGSSSTL